jgi:hypothetical protein
MFLYLFVFYGKMVTPTSTITDQVNSTLLQPAMIYSVAIIMSIMFFDRIFYNFNTISGLGAMADKLDTDKPLELGN